MWPFNQRNRKSKVDDIKHIAQDDVQVTTSSVSKQSNSVTKPASEHNGPYVEVIGETVDKETGQIKLELDWNAEFVELLRSHGYAGESDEDIVLTWLEHIHRTFRG